MHSPGELLSDATVASLCELKCGLIIWQGMAVEFWVVDTKCKVRPENALPQDGSEYYYARSVVPAASGAHAVEKLVGVLRETHIEVESIDRVIRFQDGDWSESDEFEVCESFAQSERSGEIELGCFISEKSRLETQTTESNHYQ